MSAPSKTSPPPQPVPRITPNTERAPAPAPSTASDSAKQLASLASRTGAAEPGLEIALERPAVEPCRIGVLHEAAGRRQRPGHADADAAGAARRLLERAPPSRPRPRSWRRSRGAAPARDARRSARPSAPSATPAILVPPRSIPRRSARSFAGPAAHGVRRLQRANRRADAFRGNLAACRKHEQQRFVAGQMLQHRRHQLRRAGAGANLAGLEPGHQEEALQARRLLGQERKALYGNGFCRFPVDRLAFAAH